MQRLIYNTLIQWKFEDGRRPLLFRGARQVGKTYTVKEFGDNEFDNMLSLNFERNPEYKQIFETLDPQKIVGLISLVLGEEIKVGKTLLFFDEIQECPRAITSLRYFYEEMPDLHIIGAGSLLDFALRSADLKMPVGRVQYIHLRPMSFIEFLLAIGADKLAAYVSDFNQIKQMNEVLHQKLIALVKDYFIIGGMPAVVSEYVKTKDIASCQKIQRSIIDTYIDDFAKYSNKTKWEVLQKVFKSSATMIGQKFIYSHVDKSIKSERIKEALEMLETAGVLLKINRTTGSGLPLEANVKQNFFKVLFLDIGLMHNISGIYKETGLGTDLLAIYRGAVAEQFVGQELAAYQDYYQKPNLFYWAREARNSNAEIDYLFVKDNSIIPLEVKAGEIGRLKSLKLYLDKYHPTKALKVYQGSYQENENVLSIPFYALNAFLNS